MPGNVFFLLINLEPVAAQSHFSPHLKDPKARDSSSKSRQENGRNKQRKKESDRSIGTGAQRHRKKRDSNRGTTIEIKTDLGMLMVEGTRIYRELAIGSWKQVRKRKEIEIKNAGI